MKIERPQHNEFAPFYKTYIDKIEGILTFDHFEQQVDECTLFLEENKNRLDYAYGTDKWSIREVYIHLVDTEKIFAYRLLRIARGDDTPLQGFEQNAYIDNSDFSHISHEHLDELVRTQRKNTLLLLKSLSPSSFENIGKASEYAVSVRALTYMIYGHMVHHMNILRERY